MQETITIQSQQFINVSRTTQGGRILDETFFAADGSNVKVVIDYTYTEKGHK